MQLDSDGTLSANPRWADCNKELRTMKTIGKALPTCVAIVR
jgi:hypothetical protein